MVVRCEGVSGAIADFVCSHCPLVASAEAKPLLAGKIRYGWKDQQVGSRPSGATMCKWWIEQLGGASADAQSYWQGRFAACTFVERVLAYWSSAEQLGRCPKPQQGRCPCTLQGALPLDPFWAARLGCVRLTALTCCLYPKSALHMTRCPGRHHAPPSPSNPVSDPHTRGLSPPKSSHCPTISAGTSQF